MNQLISDSEHSYTKNFIITSCYFVYNFFALITRKIVLTQNL